jgi:hypothetical protein
MAPRGRYITEKHNRYSFAEHAHLILLSFLVQDILNVIQTTPRHNVSTHLTPRNIVGKEDKLTKMLYNLKGETLRSVCQDLGLPPVGEKDTLASRIVSLATDDDDVHCARPHSISSDTSSQVRTSASSPRSMYRRLTPHLRPGHPSQRASNGSPQPRTRCPSRPVPQRRQLRPASRRRFRRATAPLQPSADLGSARVPGRLRGARPRPRRRQSPRRPVAGPPHPPLRRRRPR